MSTWEEINAAAAGGGGLIFASCVFTAKGKFLQEG